MLHLLVYADLLTSKLLQIRLTLIIHNVLRKCWYELKGFLTFVKNQKGTENLSNFKNDYFFQEVNSLGFT